MTARPRPLDAPPVALEAVLADSRAVAVHELRRRGIRGADADDAVQDCLAKAVKALSSSQARTPVELVGWLRGILRHVAADLVAARARRRSVEGASLTVEPPSDGVGDGQGRAEGLERLFVALGRLPKDDRRMIEQFYWGGASLARLARRQGCSVEAARKRKERAVARLRGALHERAARGWGG